VYASYIDEPVLREEPRTSTKLYFHRNQQYSVVAVSNTDLDVERYSYNPYGKLTIADSMGTTISNSAVDNSITYTVRSYDSTCHDYFYRARNYNSDIGMFYSRDPVHHYGTSSAKYSYCGDRPLTHVDPLGMAEAKIGCREFLQNLPADIGNTFPERAKKQWAMGPHVFCGDCKQHENLSWPDGKLCRVCLSETNEFAKAVWSSLLVHELTHCDQYNCGEKKGTPPLFGNPVPIPEFPVPKCHICQGVEKNAYEPSCGYLYPHDKDKRDKCIEAGKCYSCRIACKGMPGFEKDCIGKVQPNYP
jgi:RHS repeat-associated protein